MKYQNSIHEDSWEQRKPSRENVTNKPRIEETLAILEGKIEGGVRVFDLGVGDGSIGQSLREKYPSVSMDGCDISRTALTRASAYYDNVIQLNIDDVDVPISAGSYDLILCLDVLEHLLDPAHALSEIQRLLCPGGTAIVSVPNFSYIRYRINSVLGSVPSVVTDERHFQAFNKRSMVQMFRSTGLQLEDMFGVGRFSSLADRAPSLFAKTLIFAVSNPVRN